MSFKEEEKKKISEKKLEWLIFIIFIIFIEY